MVEAAGVEPAPLQNANWLMARDFSSELTGNSLPCCQFVVLWSALLCSGMLPSLGDMLERELPTLLSRHRRSKGWPMDGEDRSVSTRRRATSRQPATRPPCSLNPPPPQGRGAARTSHGHQNRARLIGDVARGCRPGPLSEDGRLGVGGQERCHVSREGLRVLE